MSATKLLRFTIVVPDTVRDGSSPACNQDIPTTPELVKKMLVHGWCQIPESYLAREDRSHIPWQSFTGNENDVIVIAE